MKSNNSIDSVLPDTNDKKYIKIGLSAIFIVFGIFGIWASFAPMDTGVPLPGQVVVESNKKVIQHLEGGIVEKIYVKDGDKVKKGDLLISLSTKKAKSELLSIEANYFDALATQSRLIAENNNFAKISFSEELDKLEKTQREKLVKTQLEIYKNDKSSFEKEKIITKQKIDSLSKQIESLNQTISSNKSLLKSYENELKEQQDLYEEHLIDKIKLREVERKIESLKAEIARNESDIIKANIQIDETKTQLLLDEESFFRKIKSELRKTTTSIEDMKARMIRIKDTLSRTNIKAPVSGTVLDMQIHTIGAVIAPGKPIMYIVPENSKLIIEAMLQPQYIDYVKVGLKANMTFPAFQMKGRFIKNIEGEVIFVAADSTTNKDGHSFYTVKLIVDKEGEETLRKENLKLLAGMPASVVIKIGSQTMLEYLVKPLTLMINKAFLEE
ncbi:HlyD family type I secretion periplasmic adaptor subunit [Sulfurospirillum sp. 1307]